MNIRKPHYKQIALLPTHFTLDVWICKDKEALCAAFSKKYSKSIEYIREELTPNQMWSFTGGGYKHLVINVNSLDLGVIVHECTHAMFYLSNLCGIETKYESQEWVAYMMEYIFNQAKDFKSYEVIE